MCIRDSVASLHLLDYASAFACAFGRPACFIDSARGAHAQTTVNDGACALTVGGRVLNKLPVG
eukprot:7915982-Alexandrium_andersonii.AAC.1